MNKIHILGFPRIGLNRDLKFIIEKYWKDQNSINEENLINIKNDICKINWENQINFNLNYITLGDFSYYDNVLDNLIYLNALPNRFNFDNKNINFEKYFEIARGNSKQPPMEMTKWFNTNYHYLVPEYNSEINFFVNINSLIEDIKKAKLFNKPIKIVLIGPLTLLKLGKLKDNILKTRLLLLPNLLIKYIEILKILNDLDVSIIQLDEPILALNNSKIWVKSFINTYNLLCSYFSNILLTTYFGEIKSFLNIIENINIFGLHIDLINNNQLEYISKFKFFNDKTISLGIINGKNIWKNNLEKSYYIIKKIKNINNIWISSSCSFLHIPIDINLEYNMNKIIKNWLSFATQKLNELRTLNDILFGNLNKISKDFIKNIFYIEEKKKSLLIFDLRTQKLIKNLNNLDFNHRENYSIRKFEQDNYLKLPLLPTTTIGSFPQTNLIRKVRFNYKKNNISKEDYENYIKKEINYNINKQTEYDLDVLVHGEPERNDMVEYFAELLKGFLITENGWVQSYGTRCVKPPIIYGDIYLENNMTVKWITYAQSLTNKFVKGMLTGPITMYKWSFARDDQPSYITALQISLAIQKEVLSLENNGIKIIQIDEPALRENLPLKKFDFDIYFNWASKIFLLCCNKVKNSTQIHTHICYSEIEDILSFIIQLDVDVISIECARSNMEILPILSNYKNELGLGIYDIHTKRKLKIKTAIYLIKLIINYIKEKKIWINPDCGLKTREWEDIEISLINMVKAAKLIRNKL